jgi:putative endonuclease
MMNRSRAKGASARRLTPSGRRRSLRAGLGAEWAAILYLRLKGYRVLARRYSVKGGEIDIVARRGDTLVFVEVKLRATLDDARTAIGADKRRRVSRAARAYLAGNTAAAGLNQRADAIYLAPWRWPVHARAAFELSLG